MTIIGEEIEAPATGGLRVASSIKGDVWHPERGAGAYEWWYFDALSADGRDALVIIFLDGFVFSPRYNANALRHARGGASENGRTGFPAVAVCYYRDGRPLARAVNEYSPQEFSARTDRPECRIGDSGFRLVTTATATSYQIEIDTAFRSGGRLRGAFSWSIIEGDFRKDGAHEQEQSAGGHVWNLVAPRCNVEGTLTAEKRDGKELWTRRFRGTGYHDHNRDTRWMPATIESWQWGRAHFTDATVVFYRYREREDAAHTTRLFIVRDNALVALEASYTSSGIKRQLFGLRYPRELELRHESGAVLRLTEQQVSDASFFYLRFTGAAHLTLEDGRERRAPFISEQLSPRALQRSWLYWLINMRIGRDGRHAFLP